MSAKNKNHNRIIFLTTLSVYLGLVLVGATPAALSQAAMTRQFDIKSEIEYKDDLDNKPDETPGKEDFPVLFVGLLDEIRKEVENGRVSLPTDFYVSGVFSRTENGGSAGFGSNDSLDERLRNVIENAISREFEAKAFELADADGKWKTVKISFDADQTDFSLKTSFGKSNAEQFAEFLKGKYSSASSENNLTKRAYENTKVSSENNQVFIVTRLPRAAIDEFLATSAR